ncbi:MULTISPECIES: orotate phosphoribosyltransferase [Geobacteraceae]|jgi:orotate phosphoribosyltransferase|uniref:Orotate phosphoribosyltransferase n=4 Tax=Geobacteraceae TaxID=213422 RepID=B5EF31_CITBB|nr:MULTISPECIES: orotate phosphoribosyltransferase [Geobacteraceae]ACH39340.1 orotate phosphoribosyltransferase [Citrifermentans bemidjiense Bem]BCG47432.1 Orotate phosphoribosyltransferase [Citrifermentans bremense]GAW66192.1 orotate phosphoribosyltransferase [Geoanaerobacter pelophilus]
MSEKERLKKIIIELSYEKRNVTLASGRQSDFYFDGKQTTLHPEGGYLTGKLFFDAIKDVEGVEGVGGLTLGADPIATATSIASFLAGKPVPGFIIRKEPKGHGTGAWLEGRKNLKPGSKVVIVEDVVTSGGSSIKAIKRAEEEGLVVLGVVTLVDREEGGRENIEAEGYWLKSIFTKSEILA